MNEQQKHVLLKTALAQIQAAVTRTAAPEPACDDPQLNAHCGCFVTIKNGDQLRGCIGNFTSDIPLIELVAKMARASATEDPRFLNNPITAAEIPQLEIEISVLSPLKKTLDPLSLRLGTDGIYIKKGLASGCFLPQVATETGWNAEQFLSYCCSHKAGLHPQDWKNPNTEVYLFTAEIFNVPANQIT